MSHTSKPINELEILDNIPMDGTVVVESGSDLKRLSTTKVSPIYIANITTEMDEENNSVTKCDMSFKEAYELIESGACLLFSQTHYETRTEGIFTFNMLSVGCSIDKDDSYIGSRPFIKIFFPLHIVAQTLYYYEDDTFVHQALG